MEAFEWLYILQHRCIFCTVSRSGNSTTGIHTHTHSQTRAHIHIHTHKVGIKNNCTQNVVTAVCKCLLSAKIFIFAVPFCFAMQLHYDATSKIALCVLV